MAHAIQCSDHAELVLKPDMSKVSEARRFVVDSIGTDDPRSKQDAALLTSELVTNAVAHASTRVKVLVLCDGERARVEVYDEDDTRPQPKPFTTKAESGRGLAIVDALADDWGVDPAVEHGKVVWFELAL